MADEASTETAVLTYPGGDHTLGIREATEGASALDVGKLLPQTGFSTFDPGFSNTAACASAITYIDGEAGILRYRGYPLGQLAEKSSFLELPAHLRHAAGPGRT
jgi:citrate synthase